MTTPTGYKYSGADWLVRFIDNYGLKTPSPLGLRVADLVGQVWRGIYHLSPALLATYRWSDPRYVEVVIPGYVSTFDGIELTALVTLAHDAGMRLDINPHGPRHLRLGFSQRYKRTGGMSERMPTLEENVAAIRAALGDGAPKFPTEAP